MKETNELVFVEYNDNNKKYENDIKKFIVKIMVEEFGYIQFKEKYLNADYNKYQCGKNRIWFVLENEKVIATMFFEYEADNIARLRHICCDREYRGKGIAKRMIDNAIEFALQNEYNALCLGTYVKLERAINFYRKIGFIEIENEKIEERHMILKIA